MKNISATALAARACFYTLDCLDRVVFCSLKGPQGLIRKLVGPFLFQCFFGVVVEVAFLRVL